MEVVEEDILFRLTCKKHFDREFHGLGSPITTSGGEHGIYICVIPCVCGHIIHEAIPDSYT
jgi:hypothetical protein